MTRRFGRATATADLYTQAVEVIGDTTPAEREAIAAWARECYGLPLELHDRIYDRIWTD